MPLTATQPLARRIRPAARLLPVQAATAGVVARCSCALGDPGPLRLLALPADDEYTVSRRGAHVGLSQGRSSSHLACLAGCGDIQSRHAFYRVADRCVADLVLTAHALAADNTAALAACPRIDPSPTVHGTIHR